MSNLPNPIVPGKYTTKKRSRVQIVHVEHGVALGYLEIDGEWRWAAWLPEGEPLSVPSRGEELEVAGWPLTFTPGKWYKTQIGKKLLFVGSSGLGEVPLVFAYSDGSLTRRMADGRWSKVYTKDSDDIIAECEPPEGMQ